MKTNNQPNINEITQLIDLYGALLTSTKLSYLTEYYFNDKSLNEIASANNITRTAIHSSLTSAVDELYHYEKKLNFLKKQKMRLKLYSQLKDNEIKIKLLNIEFDKREE